MRLEGFGEVDGVELLQKLPIFARLSYEQTTRLAALLKRREAPPGSTLLEENALGDALWILQEGEAEVSREAGNQREVLGTLKAGELFGEMSLVDDLLTSARVTATTRCRLLQIPRAEFEQLLAGDDKLAVKVFQSFCRTLTERLRRTNAR